MRRALDYWNAPYRWGYRFGAWLCIRFLKVPRSVFDEDLL